MSKPLSPFAVYTIRHSVELDAVFASSGTSQFTENRKWTTAFKLFDEAKKSETRMPIILAAAERTGGLLYWAIITDLFPSGACTTCSFAELRRLDSERPLRSLRLKRTGAPLSDKYIRPHAIVHTPEFLHVAG